MLLSILTLLTSRLGLLILAAIGGLIVGAFFGWNNPKAKVITLLDAEIAKAAHAGKADLLNLLTVIKSKL